MSSHQSQRSTGSPHIKSALQTRVLTPFPSGSKLPPETVTQSEPTSHLASQHKTSPKDSSSDSDLLVPVCGGCRNCKPASETPSCEWRGRAARVSSESESVEYILSTRTCYTSRSFASED